VTVYENEPAGVITAFEELEKDIRWQNTREPMFPEKVKGTVESRTADIPVTWEADHNYDAGSPESGLYVFTAKVSEGYILAQGVEAPRITVYIPQAGKMMLYMSGSDTQNDPLVITTAAQLAEIAALVNQGMLESFVFNGSNAALKLGNDIDLSSYGMNRNSGKGWIPIGTSVNPFKGHFDGNGRTITGLYINDSALSYAGLFGAVSGGNIQALALEDVYISGNNYTGGIAWGVFGNSVVQNCYTTGSVNGSHSGGLAGNVDENSVIKNCYSGASVIGTSKAGGVAGFVENGAIESCYSIGEVKCSDSTGKTVDMPVHIEMEDRTDPYFPDKGTEESPFLISKAEQLAKLADLVNGNTGSYKRAHYKLIADINLSGYGAVYNNGKGWTPIGKYGAFFYGRFDNGGYTIIGVYINDETLNYTGLFGYVYNGGTVENLRLVDVNITANSDYVGGVAGLLFLGTVQNCYVTGNINGKNINDKW